jgi:hypothetical protein
MTTSLEKRSFARHQGKGEITLQHASQDARQMEGGLINFSEQGISFFSRRPLSPGTTIMVRASGENYQHLSTDIDCHLRSMGFCTIKWCQEVTRKGVSQHEMGAVYMMPY